MIRQDGFVEDVENGKAEPLQPAAPFPKELEFLPRQIIVAAWEPCVANQKVGKS
jgi:hypothetical protein